MSHHRIVALVTAAFTFVLLMLGGFVHASGSSLACPDWPLCYGQVFPNMVGGVAIEHSHRLVASLVGLMTIVLAVLTWRAGSRTGDRTLGWLGVAALVLVIGQGVLGGITVIYRLPMAVSTAHLATSMIYFGLLLVIALRPTPSDARAGAGASALEPVTRVRPWITAAMIAVYAQLVLGALVRHTGSGSACGDDPLLCDGVLMPAWGPAALHMTHRLAGYTVALLVAVACVQVLRAARGAGLVLLPRVAVTALVVVVAQIGLGMYTVMTWVDSIVVTLHVGGGAALLACMVSMWTASRRMAAHAAGAPGSAAREPASARADEITDAQAAT